MSGCALGPLGYVDSTVGGRFSAWTARRRALDAQPRASNAPRSACPVATCQTVRFWMPEADTKEANAGPTTPLAR